MSMRRWSIYTYLFCTCLLVGLGLRFVGLGRGVSDFVLAEERGTGGLEAFYAFHPDERMVIEAALAPVAVWSWLVVVMQRSWPWIKPPATSSG